MRTIAGKPWTATTDGTGDGFIRIEGLNDAWEILEFEDLMDMIQKLEENWDNEQD